MAARTLRFDSIESLRAAGFEGFVAVSELCQDNLDLIPDVPGVYLVLRPKPAPPRFLRRSRAGFFKGKDPTVDLSELRESWVDGTPVLYIGKAGSRSGRATLRSRVRTYLAHGSGLGSKYSHRTEFVRRSQNRIFSQLKRSPLIH